VTLHSRHNKVVSLQQALEVQKTLAKHNPFVRMTSDEQKLANQAGAILKKAACTEELQDLMENEKWKALF